MLSPVIQATRLRFAYGARLGIDELDLSVERGTVFGFLGPNGAGKTTTIRLLLGFLRPSSGAALVLGQDAWRRAPQIKREVGYLPGDLRLYPWMTVAAALRVVARVRGQDLIPEGNLLAERLGLEHGVRVRAMSKGMRQKLGLVLALASCPQLLILDEPTSGLDPLMQLELGTLLHERAAAGATVFLSSHTLSEVETLCAHVAIVKRGRVVADETLDALRGRARRSVSLIYADDAAAIAAELPNGLELVRRSGAGVEATWDGPAAGLVPWLARQPLLDFALREPDLETLFRSYYTDEAS